MQAAGGGAAGVQSRRNGADTSLAARFDKAAEGGGDEGEPLPRGWKRYVSRSSGRPFYKNKVKKHAPYLLHMRARARAATRSAWHRWLMLAAYA